MCSVGIVLHRSESRQACGHLHCQGPCLQSPAGIVISQDVHCMCMEFDIMLVTLFGAELCRFGIRQYPVESRSVRCTS